VIAKLVVEFGFGLSMSEGRSEMLCSFAIQRMMPSFSGVWRLSER
jgi:hypothetical protein